MKLKQIGTVKSPYKIRGEAPRQGRLSKEPMHLMIHSEYAQALTGLSVDQEIVVLYWGDQANRDVLKTTPPGRDVVTGVFACRSPNRPNPIALNVAKIIEIQENELIVVGLDAFDGSPLLDIKPYIRMIDTPNEDRVVDSK